MTNLSDFSQTARFMKEHAGLSMRAISALMGKPGQQAQTQRIVDVKRPQNITIKTFLRFADVCGFDVHLYVTPKKGKR